MEEKIQLLELHYVGKYYLCKGWSEKERKRDKS